MLEFPWYALHQGIRYLSSFYIYTVLDTSYTQELRPDSLRSRTVKVLTG